MTPYLIRQRIEKLDFQIGIKKSEIADLQRELSAMMKKRERLEKMLPTVAEIQVTDHAILRHLQRERGIDVEGIREELKDVSEIAKRGKRPIISNNKLITIIP